MKKFLVFDVESAGLTGQGFAFGYTVVRENGDVLENGCQSAGIDSVPCTAEDREWLENNLPGEILYPRDKVSLDTLHRCFRAVVEAHPDAEFVVDCGYPVEARWLLNLGIGVYPLHELATALKLCGKDPTGYFPRLENELPKHHPLLDARQSARLWLECLKEVSIVEMKPERKAGE